MRVVPAGAEPPGVKRALQNGGVITYCDIFISCGSKLNTAKTMGGLDFGCNLLSDCNLAGTIQLEKRRTVWRACGDETKTSSRASTGGGPNGAPTN